MNEDTQITFFLRDVRSGEVVREAVRTLKGWTGLTDGALERWSVLHLERVLDQVVRDWVRVQHVSGWTIAVDDEIDPDATSESEAIQ